MIKSRENIGGGSAAPVASPAYHTDKVSLGLDAIPGETAIPPLSVVTVVLNDPAGLQRTRRSIACQSVQPEWVVVDGGSSEATLAILRELDHHVRWISGKDAGIYDAMNKGIPLCRGRYVVFMNAGDCFANAEVVAQVVAFLSSNRSGNPDVLCGGANLSFPDGRSVYRAPRPACDYIWHGLPANHQATYYRRSLLVGNPYNLKFRICGDYFMAASLFKSGSSFGYLNQPLVDFSLDGTSFVWRRSLFLEPYAIQRDILFSAVGRRFLSLAKRLLSTTVLHLLAEPVVGKVVAKILPSNYRNGASVKQQINRE